MEMKGQNNIVIKYFGHASRFSNFLLRGVLLVGVGQQIYFPQRLKYFHLAILFTYMIFLEFFRDDRRAFHEEYALVASILGCSVVTVAEYILNKSLSVMYLSILLFSIYLTGLLIMRIHKLVKSSEFEMFTVKNKEMLEKGTTFIKVLTIFIMAILTVSFMYGIYEIITLF